MIRVLVIIPAYNEEKSIGKVIAELEENSRKNSLEAKIDYVVINDHSTDSTLEVLENGKYSYIDLPINLGIGGGVQTGYRYAEEKGYDIAVQVDGDGQHDPAYIRSLLKPIIEEDYDLVIGSRFIEKQGYQSTGLRRIGISWLSFLIKLMSGKKVYDVTSGFRAAGKKAIAVFAQDYAQDYPEPESIIMCARRGMKIGEVPVLMRERAGGVSSISPLRSIYYMFKVSIGILFSGLIDKGISKYE